jgi:hypothetical protein
MDMILPYTDILFGNEQEAAAFGEVRYLFFCTITPNAVVRSRGFSERFGSGSDPIIFFKMTFFFQYVVSRGASFKLLSNRCSLLQL